MYIPLRDDHYAIIDKEDRELCSGYAWVLLTAKRSRSFYAQASVPGENGKRCILLHVLLMSPSPGEQVDHQDRNGLNCRRSNLRISSGSTNSANKEMPRTKTGYKGVYTRPWSKKFFARIKINQVARHLGAFDSARDAALAYNEAARTAFGEFAVLNEVA